jgi:hypothetical protein
VPNGHAAAALPMSMSSGVYVINIRTLCRKTIETPVATIGSP